MENKQTGFTLIELLVVIAVIGILSSTLLIGYTGVRDRAKDARAISGMSQLRVAAESYYSANGNYTNLDSNADISAILADISSQVPGSAAILPHPSSGTATKYCAQVKLNDGVDYCVDSTAKAVRGKTCNSGACS